MEDTVYELPSRSMTLRPERRKQSWTIPIALAAQLLAVAIGYGKLSQQVTDLSNDLDRLRTDIVQLRQEVYSKHP